MCFEWICSIVKFSKQPLVPEPEPQQWAPSDTSREVFYSPNYWSQVTDNDFFPIAQSKFYSPKGCPLSILPITLHWHSDVAFTSSPSHHGINEHSLWACCWWWFQITHVTGLTFVSPGSCCTSSVRLQYDLLTMLPPPTPADALVFT